MIDRAWLSDEEIELIATEAEDAGHGWAGNVKTISHHGFFTPEALRHFVNLLSSAVAKKAAEAERSACARVVDRHFSEFRDLMGEDLAQKIRARGAGGER